MEEECKPTINTGLRGITVASTKISDVIGAQGKLIYRGFLIGDLAEKASYEEVVHLLLYEKLPTADELARLKQRLVAERDIPPELIAALQTRPADSLPMDILQAATAMLANHDAEVTDQSKEATTRMGLRLIAKLPTVLAAWERIRSGKNPVAPDPSLDHAANFLYMLFGQAPDSETAHFFDVALVLHAEHSFNASTFAAREVASTRAHIYAAVASAIGSVNQILDEGKKIMGLGHAVYKTDDPRAHILAPMSKRLGEKAGDTRWYEISKILEVKGKKAFKERKGTDIFVNVDFYSASLYYSMGIPVDLFSPLFAISRVAGWTAHVLEEQFAEAAPKPMLYRPESKYVGEYCGPDECAFVPLANR
ncbi:MAG: citrate/2-methylcitrate synthase [Desulfosarcinaceae bacterium]